MRGRKGEGEKGRINLLKEDKSLFGYLIYLLLHTVLYRY